MDLPSIIFGHSHDPKLFPRHQNIYGQYFGYWKATAGTKTKYATGWYLNSGTTGMWVDAVWYITIDVDDDGNDKEFLNAATLYRKNKSDKFEIRNYVFVSIPPNFSKILSNGKEIKNDSDFQKIIPVHSFKL